MGDITITVSRGGQVHGTRLTIPKGVVPLHIWVKSFPRGSTHGSAPLHVWFGGLERTPGGGRHEGRMVWEGAWLESGSNQLTFAFDFFRDAPKGYHHRSSMWSIPDVGRFLQGHVDAEEQRRRDRASTPPSPPPTP
eukprot:GHVQ01029575.1.p1 GENE.GHVQ01029575.1~~GHVQ01029575.1.p1  ORF type:complete len:136 (-),score=14.28 GHVQ01029575.1:476-883(-)